MVTATAMVPRIRYPLASLPVGTDEERAVFATLMLPDGTAYQGISFGAEKSIAGECVFQTGKTGAQCISLATYRFH